MVNLIPPLKGKGKSLLYDIKSEDSSANFAFYPLVTDKFKTLVLGASKMKSVSGTQHTMIITKSGNTLQNINGIKNGIKNRVKVRW